MKIKEFINFLENKMKTKPNLFLFRDNEPKATIEDVNNIEKILLGKLPESFIEFQIKFVVEHLDLQKYFLYVRIVTFMYLIMKMFSRKIFFQ